MAFKTQIRLAQLSGSFGNVEGKIRDDSLVRSTLAAIPATDLSGSLSQLASSIKRMNGGAAFSAVAASTLKDASAASRITYVDGAGIALNQENGAAAALTIGSASATDKLVLFGGNAKFADAADIGSTTTVDLIKLNANDVQIKAAKSLKVDSIAESTGAAGVTIDGVLIKDNDIVIPDGATIGSVSAPTAMTIDNAGVVAFVDDIKIKDGGTIGVASAVDAMTVSSAGIVTFKDDILIKDGGTIGVASANDAMTVSSAGIVTFKDDILIKDGGTIGVASTADALTLASNGDLTLKEDLVFADGKLLGSDTTKDMLTINSNDITMKTGKTLIIQGDLQVNGTSTQLDVTTLNVEDPFILMGGKAVAANSNAGLIFMSGSSTGAARPDVVFARQANDVWALGSIASNSGSILDATGATRDISMLAKGFQLESASNKFEIASTHLTATAAANFIVDAAGDIELNADGDQIDLKFGGTAGQLQFGNVNSGDVTISSRAANKDLVVLGDDDVELIRFVGDGAHTRVASGKHLQFADAAESIRSTGARLILKSNNNDFSLPTVQSAGDQVMVFDSSGNATFTALSAGADSRNQAIKTSIVKSIVSGSILSTHDGILNIDHAGITDASLDKGTMVFVNGQLLMSGTVGDVGLAAADYHLSTDGVAPSITITFDTTTGDVAANYTDGGGNNGEFELAFMKPIGDAFNVRDDSNNATELTVASNVTGGTAIQMSGNVEKTTAGVKCNTGDLIQYTNSLGVKKIHRVNNISGNNTINVNETITGTISGGSKIQVVGASETLVFDPGNVNTTGTLSGSKIKVAYGTGLSPSIGSANSAEQVAVQLAAAINGNSKTNPFLLATVNGLVVTIESTAIFSAAANSNLTGANALNNLQNDPFGNAGAQVQYTGGADTGRKSIVMGFDLESDDVVQVSIR